MMREKDFIKSQKECADMLGMSLKEYEEYCKNIKVSPDKLNNKKQRGNTNKILKFLGIDKSMLKVRRDG